MMVYEWFENIEFANKWMLPFLGLLPVFVWLRYRMIRSLKSSFSVSTARSFRVRTPANFFVLFPFAFRLLAIGCVIIALARPQARNKETQTTGEGIDIVLCMDISGSMLTQDFIPNRFEVSKEMAIDFVKSRPVDQIGLVIFSGESFTQVPVSSDHQMLIEQIQGLRNGMLRDGTLIGEGLATAVERLASSKSKSKVVVLLTDGKETPPKDRVIDPYTALQIAKARGVKVYTIGMNGMRPAAAVQERGIEATASTPGLDEALLKRIAIQTGGQYFRATDKEGLQSIYQQIDRLERSKVEILSKESREEKFLPFIAAAVLFMLLEILWRYLFMRTFP
jgi:Ca-activated chloride channel family protein